MTKSLDEIMDETRMPAPESETVTAQPEVIEPEVLKEPPAPEEGKDQDESPVSPPEPEDGGQTVPLKALQEERRSNKELKEQNATFQQQLLGMQQQMMALMQHQQPQKPQEPEKVPEFWEDPNGFVTHALTPVQQAMERQRVQTSKLIASSQVPLEELDAMDVELAQAAQSDPTIAAEAQRIARSEHPYGELVKWHTQRKLLTEIGTDPAAYEARIREKIMAEISAQPPAPVATQPAATPTPMPSSFAKARNQGPRSTPAYGGPQPLSAITKGSAQ